jgi:hypothetical protein
VLKLHEDVTAVAVSPVRKFSIAERLSTLADPLVAPDVAVLAPVLILECHQRCRYPPEHDHRRDAAPGRPAARSGHAARAVVTGHG